MLYKRTVYLPVDFCVLEMIVPFRPETAYSSVTPGDNAITYELAATGDPAATTPDARSYSEQCDSIAHWLFAHIPVSYETCQQMTDCLYRVIRQAASPNCAFCNTVFGRPWDARRHERICWANPTVRPLQCGTCGLQFTRADCLRAHSAKCSGAANPTSRLAKRARVASPQSGPSHAIQALASEGSPRRCFTATGAGEGDSLGFVEVESAFNGVMRTYIVENTLRAAVDICGYLESMKQNIIGQLEKEVENQGAVKFYLFLECVYEKPEPHDDAVDRRAFKTKNVPVFNVADIEEVVSAAIAKICHEETDYMGKGSSWTATVVKRVQLRVNKLDLLRVSSYIPLPAGFVEKGAIINPHNIDLQCFKWAILAHFVEGANPQRVDQRYTRLE